LRTRLWYVAIALVIVAVVLMSRMPSASASPTPSPTPATDQCVVGGYTGETVLSLVAVAFVIGSMVVAAIANMILRRAMRRG
jgi:hypothetical protein